MPQLLDLMPGQCAAPPPVPERAEGRAAIVPVPAGRWEDLCKRLGDRLGRGIPKPGSPEDCDALEKLGEWFAEISRSYETFLLDALTTRSLIARLRVDKFNDDRLGITGAVVGFWNGIVQQAARLNESAADLVFAPLSGAYTLYKCLFQRYNADAVVGISVVRTILSAVKHIRSGIDPVVWITADVEVALDSLDKFLEQITRYYLPLELPDAKEATEAWLLNRIDTTQRDCIWRYHGLDPDVYETFALASRERLDWREAIQFNRRAGGAEDNENLILRERGWTDENDITMAREMYWELPGISDHLHWLQRNVFDADYVRDFALLDGFDTRFWPKFGPDLTALGMREEYAKNHYAAHWVMPSPEQLARFVYRSDEIQAATGKPFTLDDYERILTEQDYNKLARGWFKATAFQVPAISYIKEWYRQGVINRDELESYHRRLGYAPADAARFADIDDLQRRRMRTAAIHGWTTANANSAFAQGQIDEAAHDSLFIALGYTKDEAASGRQVAVAKLQGQIVTRARSRVLSSVVNSVRAGLATGVLGQQQATAALSAAGWPAQLAAGIAQLESVAARTSVVKQAIGYLRRHVLDGSITLDSARDELTRLGIVPDAVVRYTQVWALQMTPGRKRRTAQNVVSDLAASRIGRANAVHRLRNLGYSDPDARLFLADAVDKTTKLVAARVKAEESKGLKKNRELLKLAKEMNQQRLSIVKAMVRDQPVSKLDSWLKGGLIGKRYYTERLLQYGYSPNSITARIADVCKKKGATCEDTTGSIETPAPASGGGGTGPGGS